MRYVISILLIFLFDLPVKSQSDNKGTIKGRIFNSSNNEPVPFASIVVWGTNIGSVSDFDGNFLFTGIKPGYIKLLVSSVGFEDYISEEFLVTNSNNAHIDIGLAEKQFELEEVVVKASPFRRSDESPVSLQRIGIGQIEKNPGGNRDISKVIQSFPGVSSTPAYRNDVIVRGGGPSENTFYLDGVEIPNLNHFATQGASGGPVGIINADLIREVNFYSGAFPARFSNTLSSALDMQQIDGNKEKLKLRGSVGASDLAFTADGPFGEKTSYIASVRRSYLQFLFSALELPFLPTYTDYQIKIRSRPDQKNEITLISLGALDKFSLNLDADKTLDQRYILSYLPVNEQWTYTLGLIYKRYSLHGYNSLILSRNHLNNSAFKYPENNESLSKIYDYSSTEAENRIRFEHNSTLKKNLKVNFGGGLIFADYFNSTYKSVFTNDSLMEQTYTSQLKTLHYSMFGQISRDFLKGKLSTSLGLRTDASLYSASMSNPLEQLSPRISVSYMLANNLFFNLNSGIYFQRPPYTAMGYKNSNGIYVNRESGLKYIQNKQFVTGLEFIPGDNAKISVEGFYKFYSDYPFSISDSVPLSTKGADFGVIGDEALSPVAAGRAYGFEVLARTDNFKKFNVVASYTFVRSEFKDIRKQSYGSYIPTSWDNKHLFTVTASANLNDKWYLGMKWRFVGGAPYTPYDYEKSEIKEAWDVTGGPYLNYSRFNSLRLHAYHQLDIRIDRQLYFQKWSMNLYLDIQNLYNFKSEEADKLARASFDDPSQNDVYVDNGIEKYNLISVPSEGAGTILPSFGIIIEF